MSDVIKDTSFSYADKTLNWSRDKFRRNRILILFLLFGVTLAFPAYWLFRAFSTRQVILYTGGMDSDSHRRGVKLRDYFGSYGVSWFVKYEIDVRHSAGLTENRQHVSEAKPGTIILGFDQDGFAPPKNVQTLFPMTDSTLHILIKQPPRPAVGPILEINTLEQFIMYRTVQSEPKPRLRFFIGPKGSGTRLVTECVLQHYNINIAEVNYGEGLTWSEAYSRLKNGELDVVFDSGEVGSPNLMDRARENQFRMISLDKVNGIVQGQQSLVAKEIMPGAYVVDPAFASQPTKTVSTQRIIICPESISEFDAYYLTSAIQETYRDAVPVVPWDKKPTSQGTGLIVPLHPGASQVREKNSAPIVILWNFLSSNVLSVITLVGGFLTWRSARRSKNRLPVVAISHKESTYPQGSPIGPIVFGVADAETEPEKLAVEWSTDNERLFPRAGSELEKQGHLRSLTLRPPPGETGRGTITITVTDEQGGTSKTQFVLNVVAPSGRPQNPDVEPATIPTTSETLNESRSLPRPLRDSLTDLEELLERLTQSPTPSEAKTLQAFRRELDQFKADVLQLSQTYSQNYPDVIQDLENGVGKLELEFSRVKTSSKPTSRKPTAEIATEKPES
jgi:NMT1-like family